MNPSTAVSDTTPILEEEVQARVLGGTNETTRAQAQNSQSNQDVGQHFQKNIDRE